MDEKKSVRRAERTVKRLDVVRKIHHETGLSSAESVELMNSVFQHISGALIKGEDVKIAGFGTFKLLDKAPRVGRNPKTGEECIIAERKVVTFKPSVVMRERVARSSPHELCVKGPNKPTGKMSEQDAAPAGKTGGTTKFGQSFQRVSRKEWIALFELLGSFAFADLSFSKGKSEAFIQSVLEIKSIIDPKAAVTRKSISSWAQLNRNRWAKWQETNIITLRFKANLSTLQSISHRSDIIFAMVNIAVIENDYNDLDRSLIASAILDWDMPANIISDIEYVCPEIIPNLQKLS